jgi:hypothetical protein
MAAWEPTSVRRWSHRAAMGPEPRGSTGACLSEEAKPGSHVVAQELASARKKS